MEDNMKTLLVSKMIGKPKLTIFYFKPSTWHGNVTCWIQRQFGFNQPFSHVVIAVDDETLDFTTDGIVCGGSETWDECYRLCEDTQTIELEDEGYGILTEFVVSLLEEDYKIRWFDYFVPTLLYYIFRHRAKTIPISCTAPVLVSVPLPPHSLAYLPAVLYELVDKETSDGLI